jgi:hypothetical protein
MKFPYRARSENHFTSSQWFLFLLFDKIPVTRITEWPTLDRKSPERENTSSAFVAHLYARSRDFEFLSRDRQFSGHKNETFR